MRHNRSCPRCGKHVRTATTDSTDLLLLEPEATPKGNIYVSAWGVIPFVVVCDSPGEVPANEVQRYIIHICNAK